MEGESRIELEILCDGEQPLDEQGELVHNVIVLCYDVQEIIPKNIKRKALGHLHHFVKCRIYGVSSDSIITGKMWKINDNKRSSLGRYVRESTRFVWESNV